MEKFYFEIYGNIHSLGLFNNDKYILKKIPMHNLNSECHLIRTQLRITILSGGKILDDQDYRR